MSIAQIGSELFYYYYFFSFFFRAHYHDATISNGANARNNGTTFCNLLLFVDQASF